MSIDPKLRRSRDIRFRWVDGEAIVLRQRLGDVMVLNLVGGRIVELASGENDVGAIVEAICDEFEGDTEEIARDTRGFVEDLVEQGVLEKVCEP